MNKLKMFVVVLLLGMVGLFVGKVEASQYFASFSSGVAISTDTTGTIDVTRVCVGTVPYQTGDRSLILISTISQALQQYGGGLNDVFLANTRSQRIAPAIPFFAVLSSATQISQCVDLSDGSGGGITIGEEGTSNGYGLVGVVVGGNVAPNAQEWTVYTVPTPNRRRYQ